MIIGSALWATVGVIDGLGFHTGANLLAIFASTITVCLVLLSTRRRAERIFTHGYHAGYHDAAQAACCLPHPEEACDVLMLSEERAKRAL
jgi:hypothetical protein